jgi:hypothetical protein
MSVTGVTLVDLKAIHESMYCKIVFENEERQAAVWRR